MGAVIGMRIREVGMPSRAVIGMRIRAPGMQIRAEGMRMGAVIGMRIRAPGMRIREEGMPIRAPGMRMGAEESMKEARAPEARRALLQVVRGLSMAEVRSETTQFERMKRFTAQLCRALSLRPGLKLPERPRPPLRLRHCQSLNGPTRLFPTILRCPSTTPSRWAKRLPAKVSLRILLVSLPKLPCHGTRRARTPASPCRAPSRLPAPRLRPFGARRLKAALRARRL